MHAFKFDPVTLPANTPAFRQEIREFLARELPHVPAERRANCWACSTPSFSRKLGARGWIGMVWPKRYGGHERSALERYVLLEELLARGRAGRRALDRRSPVGTEPACVTAPNEQRQKYLPGMARGEILCCIGMSRARRRIGPRFGPHARARSCPTAAGASTARRSGPATPSTVQLMIALVRTGRARREEPARGPEPVPARPEHARHPHSADRRPGRVIRDSTKSSSTTSWSSRMPARQRRRRLEAGHQRTVAGAQRPGALSVQLRAVPRAGAPRRPRRFRSAAPCGRPARAPSCGRCGRCRCRSPASWPPGEDPMLAAAIVKDLGNAFEQSLPPLVQSLVGESVRLEDDSDLARTLALLLQTVALFQPARRHARDSPRHRRSRTRTALT